LEIRWVVNTTSKIDKAELRRMLTKLNEVNKKEKIKKIDKRTIDKVGEWGMGVRWRLLSTISGQRTVASRLQATSCARKRAICVLI
jgi:hypothetical protein